MPKASNKPHVAQPRKTCEGLDCSNPLPSRNHQFCAECRVKRDRERGYSRKRSPAKRIQDRRDYGWTHIKARNRLKPAVATGTVVCAKCGHLIPAGAPWDLGHNADRTGYIGALHRRCNRATATVTKPLSKS